jgi:hypothetical protein
MADQEDLAEDQEALTKAAEAAAVLLQEQLEEQADQALYF